MAEPRRSQRSTGIQYTLEVLFSLNLAFALVFLVFLSWRGVSGRFNWLEGYIRVRLLRMQPTDFNSGYIGFWLPSVILGLCTWALLRIISKTHLGREVLRLAPGFVALFSLPAAWLYLGTPIGAFQWGAPVELILALYGAYRFLKSSWLVPALPSVVLLWLHFLYWYLLEAEPLTPAALWYLLTHGVWGPMIFGAPASILSFCSSLVWGVHIRGLQAKTSMAKLPAK